MLVLHRLASEVRYEFTAVVSGSILLFNMYVDFNAFKNALKSTILYSR